jgi:hypothetical protein
MLVSGFLMGSEIFIVSSDMVHNVRFGWMVDRYVGCLLGRLRLSSCEASYGGLVSVAGGNSISMEAYENSLVFFTVEFLY